MANKFKSDESFLRKLAIGAAGTNATINRLKLMGFNPIELERGSTSYKIWKKIKIKRVRVPDILCLKTGIRFESRGKTKPEISMSHSTSDNNRVWDVGLRDDDFVSIVVFEQSDDSPVDPNIVSPIHFIKVKDMRQTFQAGQVSITKPKGVEEGSERRVMWPCAAANKQSTISAIDTTKNMIILAPISHGRKQSIHLSRNKGQFNLLPQVNVNNTVETNQIVASVVPVQITLQSFQSVDNTFFVNKLNNRHLSERYSAAKALRYLGPMKANAELLSIMNDSNEDIYVQLEAAAALAAHNFKEGWDFIEGKLQSQTTSVPLQTQLETIIVASEIHQLKSEDLLIKVLQDSQKNDELRAGAAWALGEFVSNNSANALVDTFNLNSLEIKVEAARALLQNAESQIPHLIDLLKSCDHSKRDGICWVLTRIGKFKPSDLLINADQNLKMWISYIVGFGKNKFDQADIDAICNTDPKIYFAASVLWQILASWIDGLKEY